MQAADATETRTELCDEFALAVDLLQGHFGPSLQASRQGGRHQLAAYLQSSLNLTPRAAERMLCRLENHDIISWVSDYDESRSCPRILELCGVWKLRA